MCSVGVLWNVLWCNSKCKSNKYVFLTLPARVSVRTERKCAKKWFPIANKEKRVEKQWEGEKKILSFIYPNMQWCIISIFDIRCCRSCCSYWCCFLWWSTNARNRHIENAIMENLLLFFCRRFFRQFRCLKGKKWFMQLDNETCNARVRQYKREIRCFSFPRANDSMPWIRICAKKRQKKTHKNKSNRNFYLVSNDDWELNLVLCDASLFDFFFLFVHAIVFLLLLLFLSDNCHLQCIDFHCRTFCEIE